MRKVMLNSLPKSGTHLLVKMFQMFGYEFANCNLSSTTIYGRYSSVKWALRGTHFSQPGIDVGLDISAAARTAWIHKKLHAVKASQYCGGHLPYSDALHRLLLAVNIQNIYIVRDPRDVVLSWAHYVPTVKWHYGRKGLLELSLDEQVKKILYGYNSGSFMIESFPQILERALGWTRDDNSLVVKFEDLIGEKGGGTYETQVREIKKIMAYLSVTNINAESVADNLFGNTKVFRRGKIGAWRDELLDETQAEMNEYLKTYVSNMGYE